MSHTEHHWTVLGQDRNAVLKGYLLAWKGIQNTRLSLKKNKKKNILPSTLDIANRWYMHQAVPGCVWPSILLLLFLNEPINKSLGSLHLKKYPKLILNNQKSGYTQPPLPRGYNQEGKKAPVAFRKRDSSA